MGAHNVIPTIPSFVAGAPALTDLQNLAYASSFLIDHGTRPTWKFIASTISGSVTANTWTVVPVNTSIYDSDGVWSSASNGAVIVTQGYYALEACVQPEISATRFNFITAFKWTAGTNNPHSASSPAWFGYRGIDTSTVSGASNSGCISAITPVPMYPGDTLQAMLYLTSGVTLEANDNAGQPTIFMAGRFSMQFTGRWVREGS